MKRESKSRRDMRLVPFIKALRASGWRLDYDSRAGGERIVQFVKTFGQRKVEVQLFENGGHRTSHFLNGRMSTRPTGFRDVLNMWASVKHERTRTDHPRPI